MNCYFKKKMLKGDCAFDMGKHVKFQYLCITYAQNSEVQDDILQNAFHQDLLCFLDKINPQGERERERNNRCSSI